MLDFSSKRENFKIDVATSLEQIKNVLLVLVIVFTLIYSFMEISMGIKFVLNAIVAVIFAREAEMLFLTHHQKMTRLKAKEYIEESKPEISGLLLALLLPVSAPLYVTLIGIVFGVFIVRMAFGGVGNNVFNVAIASLIFIKVSWAALLASTGANSLTDYLLSLIMNVNYQPMDNLLFNSLNFGSITTSGFYFVALFASLIILLCFIYLAVRRVIKPLRTIGALLAFYLLFLFLGHNNFGLMFITSPAVLLVTIFCLNDPITMPNKKTGTLMAISIFVIATGYLVGASSNMYAIFFAVLIMNMFVPLIDAKLSKVPYILASLIILIGGAYVVDATKVINETAPTQDANSSATAEAPATDANGAATGEAPATGQPDANGAATGEAPATDAKPKETTPAEDKKTEGNTPDANSSATKEGN